MKTDREKLIELIKEIKETCRQIDCDDCIVYKTVYGDCQAYLIADYLISKGVTIPVHCGECKYWMGEVLGNRCKRHGCIEHIAITPAEAFCSYGERKEE